MKARGLKNMPVVSMTDGSKIGNIKEIMFDTAELKAAALLLESPGTESFLPYGSIRNIGTDAVTVEKATAIQGTALQSALQGLRGLDTLVDASIVSGDGTLLGQLVDVFINPADGRIVELTAHSGGILGIGGTTVTIASSDIRGIGPNIITVETPPAEEPPPAE